MKAYASPLPYHPTVMVISVVAMVYLLVLLSYVGDAKLPPIAVGSSEAEKKPKGFKELIHRPGDSHVNGEVRMNGTGWHAMLLNERTKLDLYNSIRIDIGKILTIGSGSVRVRRMVIEDEGLTMLVGLINDGTHAIDDKTFGETIKKNIKNPEAIPLTREVYKRSNKNGANTPVISGFSGMEVKSSSICSDTVTPDRCIMIIGISVIIACAIIILLMMYFLCFRSPFVSPPIAPSKGAPLALPLRDPDI